MHNLFHATGLLGRASTDRVPRRAPRRRRLTVERLESRDLPAPLTWFAGPTLPAARGGAVAAADQGSAFTLLGGGPSDVLAVDRPI